MDNQSKQDVEGGNQPVKSYSTAGLVLGILGIFTSLVPIIGLPIQIIGLVLSSLSLKSHKRGQAIAGLTLCIMGIILSGIWAMYGAYTATHPLTPDQICKKDIGATSYYLGYKNADGTYACSTP